jgi:hypothetical protein
MGRLSPCSLLFGAVVLLARDRTVPLILRALLDVSRSWEAAMIDDTLLLHSARTIENRSRVGDYGTSWCGNNFYSKSRYAFGSYPLNPSNALSVFGWSMCSHWGR